MKRALWAIAAVILCLVAYSPARAVIPGSKITVTFEGLVKRTKAGSIVCGYDGLDFDTSFQATGKAVYKDDPGFQAVIRGGVACVLPQFSDWARSGRTIVRALSRSRAGTSPRSAVAAALSHSMPIKLASWWAQ
jgi:hypothetical protein